MPCRKLLNISAYETHSKIFQNTGYSSHPDLASSSIFRNWSCPLLLRVICTVYWHIRWKSDRFAAKIAYVNPWNTRQFTSYNCSYIVFSIYERLKQWRRLLDWTNTTSMNQSKNLFLRYFCLWWHVFKVMYVVSLYEFSLQQIIKYDLHIHMENTKPSTVIS